MLQCLLRHFYGKGQHHFDAKFRYYFTIKMEKFATERIEDLKCEYYKLIALLEVQKHIVISDIQLRCFEKKLSECETEDDAAAFLFGSIRRYKILLEAGRTELLECS